MRVTKFNKNTIAALSGAIYADAPWLMESVVYQDTAPDSLSHSVQKNTLFVYSFTTPQAPEAFGEFAFIRKNHPEAAIIAGGPHASGAPESVLNSGADYVVAGEGESAFTSLLKSIASGETPGRGVVAGTQVDFSHYPAFPLNDPDRALYIELTRGCPYHCSFCQTSSIFGTNPRHRTVDSVLENAATMLKYNLTDLRFVSPNALSYGSKDGLTPSHEKLEQLLKQLYDLCRPRGGRIFLGSFPSEIRPEFVTPDAMALLRKYVANDNVIIGGQSGSEKVLNAIGRGSQPHIILQAVKTALKAGFKVNVDFLFGFEEELDDKEALESVGLMEKILQSGARIHAHKLISAAGTVYYNKNTTAVVNPLILNFLHKNLGKGLIYGNF